MHVHVHVLYYVHVHVLYYVKRLAISENGPPIVCIEIREMRLWPLYIEWVLHDGITSLIQSCRASVYTMVMLDSTPRII